MQGITNTSLLTMRRRKACEEKRHLLKRRKASVSRKEPITKRRKANQERNSFMEIKKMSVWRR